MYQVFFDKYPLYDPRDPQLYIRDPDVHLAVGEAGEMFFTIDPDHPYAGRLTRLRGTVELRAAGRAIFKGRIRKDTRGFELSREIEVEGLLACLNDSIIPPFNFPEDFLEDAGYQAAAKDGNVVAFFLGWLLAQHNSQVGPAQQIQLGDVTVADSNNYITRASSDYITTMEAVKKRLVDLLGGHLLPDYSGATTVLHYYADLPLTNVQEVEFGENLLDLVEELDSADTYTAILPIGAEGLTLAELPDGEISPGIWKDGRIIYSKTLEDDIGGRITKKVAWDDVTLATNLRTKAAAMLTGEGVKTAQTITAKAVDLGAVDDLPRFVVGRYVKLHSAPHGFSDMYPLMELDPDILDPGNTKITMGRTTLTLLGIYSDRVNEQIDHTRVELKDYVSKVESDLKQEIQSTVVSKYTEIIATSEQLILSALESYAETSDLEALQQTVAAQLQVMADEISMTFTETTDRITEVDGDLQRTLETLSKHFDFGIDGLTIRAGEHSMSLKLDNGIISFQRDGQQFGWWDGVDFHTGNIVVDVNERAQFGNFAAIPRSNGSLSWLKVRG